ncbi:hypothetical protein DRE_02763 [Drechslerella stenobrocha 248]|uniref:Uncharacterized protein n=1 Tax=Drechslerella stenobrocha 248 TaxID=1043628 RepID=W7HUJ3_9PEZI|nr:hypothetical protein DRE_02763 [Drechslerella stenobrocha 248]
MNALSSSPASKLKKPVTSQAFRLIVLLVTLPYHRFFLYNTLRPSEIIENYAPHGTEDGSPQREKIHGLLRNWRARKKAELEFITIAGVAETAIVTATLSWESAATSHWVGIWLFYSSLTTSIIGMLLAAQQNTLLTLLGEFSDDWRQTKRKFLEGYLTQLLTEDRSSTTGPDVEASGYRARRWRLSWQMVFVWQIPMMGVGYSFLFYIIGLTVLICTPLMHEPWGDNSKVAVGYLAVSGLAWGIFMYCSMWGYRNVALDKIDALSDEDEEEGEFEQTASRSGDSNVPVEVVRGDEITQGDQKWANK